MKEYENKLDYIMYKLENGEVNPEKIYKDLSKIIIAQPDLKDKVFKAYEKTISCDNNNETSLEELYLGLMNVFEKYPEFSPQIINACQQGLSHNKNKKDTNTIAYVILNSIAEYKSDFTVPILYTLNDSLNNHEQDWKSLAEACKVLNTSGADSNLGTQLIKICEAIADNPNHNDYSLGEFYKTLGNNIIINHPKKEEKIL